ncbi:MAG: hypothetical protein KAS86_03945, partial [Candidatus Omnitrophica bacterium]|nr:hypothetical protein [Candidatus Omnitrophota bacterium]
MRRVFLLEDYDFSFPLETGESEVISLDPGVSYRLQKRGVDYRIAEDLYDEKALRMGQEAYFHEQLEWFRGFDGFLKEHILFCGEHDIPLAKACYLRLKYFVDTVIIYSYIISRLLESNADAGEIVYVSRPYDKEDRYSVFDFKHENRKVFGSLLRLFCDERDIVFKRHFLHKKERHLPQERLSPGRHLLDALIENGSIKAQAKKVINA